ncbi:MAG: hypothetical protein ABA06_03810 [Parcubacteria bacterium C7867-001]|nr:MAG: hypothetical protein ABA06_03810 [Parcubacteria bacterium C7867-001]
MQIYQPPQPVPVDAEKLLFLAGSIEMGAAEEWQKKVQDALADTDWIILNPRRDDWDNSWVQEKENAPFREQVEWELEGLERAEKILMYLDPTTKSPVSMIELGLFGKESGKLIMICPKGFWRKGNIDIVCERYGITQVDTLEEALSMLRA